MFWHKEPSVICRNIRPAPPVTIKLLPAPVSLSSSPVPGQPGFETTSANSNLYIWWYLMGYRAHSEWLVFLFIRGQNIWRELTHSSKPLCVNTWPVCCRWQWRPVCWGETIQPQYNHHIRKILKLDNQRQHIRNVENCLKTPRWFKHSPAWTNMFCQGDHWPVISFSITFIYNINVFSD